MFQKRISFMFVFFVALLCVPPLFSFFTSSSVVNENYVDIVQLGTTETNPVRHYKEPQELGTTKQSAINTNWQEGESFHTVYDFPNAFISDYTHEKWGVSQSASYNDPVDVYTTGVLSYTHDAGVAQIWYVWVKDDSADDPIEYAGANVIIEIPVLTSGTLYYDYDIFIDDSSSGTTPITQDSTYSVDKDDIDNDGFLRLQFRYYAYMVGPANNSYVDLDIISGASTEGIYDSGAVEHSSPDIFKVGLAIDELYFVRDDIIADIRTEWRYTATNQREHRIFIENFEYNTELKVYPSESLTFSTITPECTVTENSGYYSFTDTVPVTYEILFDSNSSKQYLAISDQTSEYLSDIGFEGSYLNDWIDFSSSFDFDTKTLNSTIVYEGAFSLRLEDQVSDRDILTNNFDLPAGYYYVSFATYTESMSEYPIDLRYKDNTGSWIEIDTDPFSTPINRWQNHFYFIHTLGGTDCFRFDTQADNPSFVLFMDNFKVWQVNHVQETSAYQQIKVSGQLINWDGYENPSVDSETINLEVRDRTADSSIMSTTKTTEANGNFEWTIDTASYSELQDQREIEFRSWNNKSYFGSAGSIKSEDITDSITGWSISGESTTESITLSDGYLVAAWDKNTEGATFLVFAPTGTWDLSNIDFITYKVKCNTTITSHIQQMSDGVYVANWNPDFSITTTESTRYFDYEDYSPQTGFSRSDVYSLSVGFYTTGNFTLQIKDYYFIQAQKSYFTPLITTDFPYEWDTGRIDFSEGVQEHDDDQNLASESWEDGFYRIQSTSGQSSLYIDWNIITDTELDTSIYTHLRFRLKSNASIIFRAIVDHTSQISDIEFYTAESGYIIYEYNLSIDTDWKSGNSQIAFYIYDQDWSTFEGDEFIWIDYFEFIYRDTPSLSVADSFAYVSSSNNSFNYRIEIDDAVQGYYTDLSEIALTQKVGNHTINATVFDDIDRSSMVFLPGTSVTDEYSIVLKVTVSTPILVDGRISLAVVTNYGNSQVYINDDSKAGIEVNWESEGVFSWYSNIVGENNISISVRNDVNNDGDYSDTGETKTLSSITYHLYDTDLEIVSYSFLSYTDEGATFSFQSNYRGSAKTEFRCRITDEVAFSQWLSEDTYNGTYSFTFSIHDLDTTYNFTTEIRAYITDESPGYQYKYFRFEFTPYNPDVIYQPDSPIDRPSDEEEIEEVPTPYASFTVRDQADMILLLLLFMGMTVVLAGGVIFLVIYYYNNRILKDSGEFENPMETITRKTTEETIKATDKITGGLMSDIFKVGRK